jgi:spermidine/putrescine transport system permease protein
VSAVAAPARPLEERGPAPRYEPNRRWTRFILPTYTIVMILYLSSPIFAMILYGFNDIPTPPDRQTPKFWGFTLDWWKNVWNIPGLPDAFRNSLKIAFPSALVATAVGTLFGLALGRYRFRGIRGVGFVIFLAIAVPEIVLGASLLSLFVQWPDAPVVGVFAPNLGLPTLLLSHVGFSIAFVAVTIRARVQGLDRNLEDAAQDLFASPVTAFFKVTLPLIAPAILAGFLLAFVLSLDDFVISNFVAGQEQTFPLWVFGAQRIGIPPQVNVMGTLLFGAGVLAAVVNVLAQRRKRWLPDLVKSFTSATDERP